MRPGRGLAEIGVPIMPRPVPFARRLLLLLVIGISTIDPVVAGVTSRSVVNSHWVEGTTARAVVSDMARNPFPGDHGAAYANVRPRYDLTVGTAERGGACVAAAIDLHVQFTMTLPKARDESRMTPGTRAAWTRFVAFARRHEETHVGSYLAYARSFAASTIGLVRPTCIEVRLEVHRRFAAMRQTAELAQSAFDRQQAGLLRGLGLFRMAGR